jgi:hypothetical protein
VYFLYLKVFKENARKDLKKQVDLYNRQMTAVFYEFKISRRNIEFLVEDLEIAKRHSDNFSHAVNNLLDLVNTDEKTYAIVEVKGKPGLMLRISKKLCAERLPYIVEGAHAFIHPSSEGYLELEDFKSYLDDCLNRHRIPFKRYD